MGTSPSNQGERISHLGYFRGVDNAAEIRDLIIDRMRGLRDSGLGDPDEGFRITKPQRPKVAVTGELISAASGLLAEARALRSSVERGSARGDRRSAPGPT